tara:strand:- start:1461 stop:1691 length:231 start_codon:yes stop_codon:yes gene_type:complete
MNKDLYNLIAQLQGIENGEVKEAMSNVDKITQLTDELYNELVAFENEEHDEKVEELIGHLAEFKAQLQGDQGAFDQ